MTLWLWLACVAPAPKPQTLSVEQLVHHVRDDAGDKTAWATAVRDALITAAQPPDAPHACQVLAIVEQESGYEVDPAVPGLGDIATRELLAEIDDKLGFLGPTAAHLLLDVTPEGEAHSFRERLSAVRTEGELDHLFRDMVTWHAARAPRIAAALRVVMPRLWERLNPISTAGSMQVNVGFAQDQPESDGLEREEVRELLYTLDGGVRYGTLRLYAFQADYDDPIYRFADYNAGFYASRNASLQDQLSALTGEPLVPDGDIIAWKANGHPAAHDSHTLTALLDFRARYAPDLTEAQVRRHARREKERRFERTETWRQVRAAWAEAHDGQQPPYARVPDVALDSPKLKGDWSTRSFAERVDRRYQDCLKRG